MRDPRILLIDDDESLRMMLSIYLKKEGYLVDMVGNGKQGLDLLDQEAYGMVLCDLRMPIMDGMTFLRKARRQHPEISVIVMTAYGSFDIMKEVLREGAIDYLSKPFKTDDLLLTIKKSEERLKLPTIQKLAPGVENDAITSMIVTKSAKMLEIFDTITKISEYKTTVLIQGESGTGKELVARAIHLTSNRAKQPFVTINCGAIPENLLESELFGHVKGAFTGAHKNKKGLFEEANNGTIFLDEIGELPLILQVKLLRVLQEEEIRKVGDTASVSVNVRIIAATHKDLAAEVERGNFREDLYYRLNVLPLDIPPLRERKEDIPLLVQHFLRKNNEKMKTSIEDLSHDVLRLLMNYDWSGNVRELENTMERAMVLSHDAILGVSVLPPAITNFQPVMKNILEEEEEELSIKKIGKILEERLIRKALTKTRGNRTQAAKILEISHRALIYKIQEYNIEIKKQ